jgi:poly(3-hydroxybutyrate) depolymerase
VEACRKTNYERMIRFLSLSILLSIACFGFNAAAQQEFRMTSPSVIGYLEYLPKEYKNSSRNFPVLIFLHGIGEQAPNTSDPNRLQEASKKLVKHGPPQHIKNGTDFPFIVISPQLKSGVGNWPVWYVMEVIEHVKKTLRVDNSRIYLTGLSLGGGGVWTIAQEYPKMFAAIAPVCGGFNSPPKAKGIADTDLPVWAFHGDHDPIVPLGRSERMVNAINSYNPNPRAKLSVYEGVKHDAWEKAYQPNHSIHSPNMYEWFMTFTNNEIPDSQNAANILPVASAGNDATISLSQSAYVIKGSGTDKDGKVVSYLWEKTSGATVTMQNTTTAELSISDFIPGTYTFRFIVTDNAGGKASDIVEIKVLPNQPAPTLTVSAGPDIRTTSGNVIIKGIGEVGNAPITSYEWSQSRGKNVKMHGQHTPELKLSGLKPGKYGFLLTIKDGNSTSVSDEMELTVNPRKGTKHGPPVANAGKDVKVSLPVHVVHLRGIAFGNKGKVVSYRWVQTNGKRLKIHNANKLNAVLPDIRTAGTRTFKLIVKDKSGRVKVDHVKVFVTDPRTKGKTAFDSTVVVQEVFDSQPAPETSPFDLNNGREWDPNLVVMIYNDRGDKLYQGAWKADSYQNIFNHSGFFVYQIWDRSRRIYTGKLVIR